MELSPTLLILAGFIIVLLGIGAGMLISSLTEEEEPEEEGGPQNPPGARKGRYQPVARLWRDSESGHLVVESEGKTYLGPAAMSQPQRQGLESAARDLRGWLEMGLEPAPSAPPSATPATQIAADPRPAPVPYSVSRDAPAPAVVGVTAPAAAAEEARSAGPRSIVMQIEDILQDMIAGSGLARQGLHLHEDPSRGVIVTHAGKSYEGIEAVPDGEAKQAIRAAVSEWEKTQ